MRSQLYSNWAPEECFNHKVSKCAKAVAADALANTIRSDITQAVTGSRADEQIIRNIFPMPPTALPVASLSNILGKGPSAPRLQEFYTLGPVLGKGAFGTVYQAVDKKTGVAYACKSISKAKLVCKEDIEDVQRVRFPYDSSVLSLSPHTNSCHPLSLKPWKPETCSSNTCCETPAYAGGGGAASCE